MDDVSINRALLNHLLERLRGAHCLAQNYIESCFDEHHSEELDEQASCQRTLDLADDALATLMKIAHREYD